MARIFQLPIRFDESNPLTGLTRQSLTTRQLASGDGLGAFGRFARMLRLYELAVESECEGVQDRADFYWNAVASALEGMWAAENLWNSLHQRVGAALGADDGRTLRETFAVEVLIDTHRAFFSAHVQLDEGFDSRAFRHSAWVARLLKIAAVASDRRRALLGPLLERRVEAYHRAGRWSSALELARSLAEQFPGELDYQDRLAQLEVEAAMASVSSATDEASSKRHAGVLHCSITSLERDRGRFTENDVFYDALGVLYRAYSVELANSGAMSSALEAAEAALAYTGDAAEMRQLREELGAAMRQRQEAMRDLLRRVAAVPNATLSDAGQKLVREAQAGFQAADRFRSTSRKPIVDGHVRAKTAALFRRAGIEFPSANPSPEALRSAFSRFLASPPERREDVAEAWQAAVKSEKALAHIDTSPAAAVFERRLFGDPEADLSIFEDVFTVSRKAKAGEEPFAIWFFSRVNLGTKIAAAVGIVLMIASALFYGLVTRSAGIRDGAYQQLRSALAAGDDGKVIQAAEEFFDTWPRPRGDQTREEEAMDAYSAAMARWFIQVPDVSNPLARDRIVRYRKATSTLARVGMEGAEQ